MPLTRKTKRLPSHRRRRIALILKDPFRDWKQKSAIEFVLKGILVTVFTVGAHYLINETRVLGDGLRDVEYRILQKMVSLDYRLRDDSVSFEASSKLPVIIDISEGIPYTPDSSTDLSEVNEIVTALHDLGNDRPRAIGIDVDVSPRRNGPADDELLNHPADWQYFKKWLALNSTMPVRVGVFRRRDATPEQWLGDGQFQSLASGLLIPKDTQRNYTYVKSPDSPLPLYELAASLYMATTPHTDPPFPEHWYSQIFHSGDEGRERVGYYAVNYSYLADIKSNQVIRYARQDRASLPAILREWKEKIGDTVVLIGDVAIASDQFRLAQAPNPEPGIFIHACSLMTLRDRPLRYIDEFPSLILDILLALGTLTLTVCIPLIIGRHHPHYHRAEFRSRIVVLALLLLPCCLLVGWLRIFWPDFIVVSMVLCLDTKLSDPFWRATKAVVSGPIKWIGRGYSDE